MRELGADAGFNGRNDLLIGGRKFSGNAQYRLPGCIVHHGSLLYDTDLAQMAAATTVDPYKIQSKSIKSVRDRVTNISEHLPRKLPAKQFKACMLRHLMRGSTQTYCLTPADDARIRALAEENLRPGTRSTAAIPASISSGPGTSPAASSPSAWTCSAA